ncbi:hypothetical protein K1I87_10875 [Streptococcus gordonii]|uniref:hypothetical protein n=1 Tax=Streptococcus gordonii TaxID=1302 RepID=UPI001CC01E2B|nr:hypothetical protein [Streptococcus gordonii]MBZ2136688.1 hypothetical protein [Streptococcus gordonii]
MKTRTYTKMIVAVIMASSLLLGACGKKEESTTSTSSSKTIQASSSSKVTSSSKFSASPKVSNSTSSEGVVSQSGQTEAPASQQQYTVEALQGQQTQPQQVSGRQNTKTQATQPAQAPESNRQLQNKQAASNARYKGVLTMVDGDFSAAAGTWKGANGNTVTVSGNGQFTVQSADGKTDNYSIASYSYTLDDGKYNAQLSGPGNANLQITTGADGSVTSVVVTQP